MTSPEVVKVVISHRKINDFESSALILSLLFITPSGAPIRLQKPLRLSPTPSSEGYQINCFSQRAFKITSRWIWTPKCSPKASPNPFQNWNKNGVPRWVHSILKRSHFLDRFWTSLEAILHVKMVPKSFKIKEYWRHVRLNLDSVWNMFRLSLDQASTTFRHSLEFKG